MAPLIVEPHNYSIKEHMALIEKGDYALPEFQRTFVWDEYRVTRLWDSIFNGYPIGDLMFWRPPRDIDFPMRSLGIKQSEISDRAEYSVVDGQQRLTAIWLVLKGQIPLYYNLEKREFHLGRKTDNSIDLDLLNERTVDDAINRNFFHFKATGDQKERFAAVLDSLNSIFSNKLIPGQAIRGSDYSTVVEIFKRVNQQGEPLSEAQLALAGISDKWSGVFRKVFDLLKKLNDEMGFDKVEDPNFIVQAWTAIHTDQHLLKHLSPEKGIRSKYAEMATKEKYEESWGKLIKGVHILTKIMKDRLDLKNFQFVKAYFPLVVVINYFANRSENEEDIGRMTKWLLCSFIQSRYSVRAMTKLREDIKATRKDNKLKDLFSHRWEALNPDDFELNEEVLLSQDFKSTYSTLLYILVRKQKAVDFINQSILVGDQKRPDGSDIIWHFHHIFPDKNFDGERSNLKNELERVQQEGSEDEIKKVSDNMIKLEKKINNIANLAFLLPESNSSFGSRRPSDYLEEICSKHNGEDILRNQFIPLDRSLWHHEAFDRFCAERRKLIAKAATLLLKSF